MAIHETRFTVPGFETAKTVQLRGSWDGYSAYYLLVWDERSAAWKGTFPLALHPGQHRYHYLIDGCHFHVSSEPSAYEPKIGNNVNILNIQRQSNSDIPQGRPLSTSQIVAPTPCPPSSSEISTRLERTILDQCSCGIYGFTSDGRRIKMSCGGSRCGDCDED